MVRYDLDPAFQAALPLTLETAMLEKSGDGCRQ